MSLVHKINEDRNVYPPMDRIFGGGECLETRFFISKMSCGENVWEKVSYFLTLLHTVHPGGNVETERLSLLRLFSSNRSVSTFSA